MFRCDPYALQSSVDVTPMPFSHPYALQSTGTVEMFSRTRPNATPFHSSGRWSCRIRAAALRASPQARGRATPSPSNALARPTLSRGTQHSNANDVEGQFQAEKSKVERRRSKPAGARAHGRDSGICLINPMGILPGVTRMITRSKLLPGKMPGDGQAGEGCLICGRSTFGCRRSTFPQPPVFTSTISCGALSR